MGCLVITGSEPVAITWSFISCWNCLKRYPSKVTELWSRDQSVFNLRYFSAHTHTCTAQSSSPSNNNRQNQTSYLTICREENVVTPFLQYLLWYIWIYARSSHVCWNTWLITVSPTPMTSWYYMILYARSSHVCWNTW